MRAVTLFVVLLWSTFVFAYGTAGNNLGTRNQISGEASNQISFCKERANVYALEMVRKGASIEAMRSWLSDRSAAFINNCEQIRGAELQQNMPAPEQHAEAVQ